MESVSSEDHSEINLPPGFRFHPTDEELITHYLSKKVFNSNFKAIAIGEVDLNKNEPWELAWKAKVGEKHWYFFCLRDRKYPTGLRTNRATEAGYWKATGKDKEICRAKVLVGMKKTLVFYKGRAPKGEKTNWIMHEYRIEEKCSLNSSSKATKNEWVICRIFEKYSGAKKITNFGLGRFGAYGNEFGSTVLPPLIDSASYDNKINIIGADTAHVPCLSSPIESNHFSSLMPLSKFSQPSSFYPIQHVPNLSNLRYSCSSLRQDQFAFNKLMEKCKTEREMTSFAREMGLSTNTNTGITSTGHINEMGSQSYEDQDDISASDGSVDLESLWNY